MTFKRALAASCVAAACMAASWAPMGAPIVLDAIVAADLDVDASGDAFIAYGSTDASTGATAIIVAEFLSSAWSKVASHEPQFAQSYDDFSFKTSGRIFYIGLRIVGEGYASVLRGEGGYDGFDGCYAWSANVYDYDINAGGDMRMLSASGDNSSVYLSTYNHSGWDTYPAGDTWGPETAVPTSSALLDAIVVVRGAGALYGVMSGSGSVQAVQFAPSNVSTVTPVGTAPFSGDGIAAAWANNTLCVASSDAAAAARVHCIATGTAGAAWSEVGVAIATGAATAQTSIALTNAGVLVVGVLSAADASVAIMSTCTLTSALVCALPWTDASLTGSGSLTSLTLRYNPVTSDVYALTTATVSGTKDAVAVYTLAV